MMKTMRIPITVFLAVLLSSCNEGTRTQTPVEALELDLETASHFADLALKGIQREYPNKPGHVLNNASEVMNPASLHPSFYGCFDWHSAVHGHWMLVKLLKLYPDLPQAEAIRKALDENLSAGSIRVEVEYYRQANRKSFERTYGWAWLLKLAEELCNWDDSDGKNWSANLQPLADEMVARYLDFLPRQTYPIRRGVHPNTAFGIAFALDYARAAKEKELEELLVEQSLAYFGDDRNYPAQWEPDGDDFFSRSLMEADLMRRVLDPGSFKAWFHRFLPGIDKGEPACLLEPAEVSDRSDPKIVHLDGLNLSRAWCMKGIASSLPATDPARNVLLASAYRQGKATLPHISSGNYEGEHWLASFAIFMYTYP